MTGARPGPGGARSGPSGARSGPSGASPEETRLREDAWDDIAAAYHAFWGPRLQPYRERALALFHPVPPGPLAVPGCGPGDEVILLAADDPGRSILATDTSPEMLSLLGATLRERDLASVIATVGPAEGLSAFVRQAAGILSCFCLDLLPNPIAALADWSRCIRAGGSIAAIFWTRPRTGSPTALLCSTIQARTGHGGLLWEARAVDVLPKLGLRLARDEKVQFEIPYESPEEFFRGMVEAGPLHFIELRFGRDLLRDCKRSWLVHHGLRRKGAAWVDLPEARLWVLERTGEGSGEKGL